MWTLVWSPTRFLSQRLRRPVHWPSALLAPLLCAALQTMGALLLSSKTQPLIMAALPDHLATRGPYGWLAAVAVGVGSLLLLGVLTLAVLAINVLARRPGAPERLTELTALAFYTQVPYALAMTLLAVVWDPPAPPSMGSSSTVAIIHQMEVYRERALAGPLPATARLLSIYSLAWLAVVVALATSTVSRLSRPGTFAVAGFLLVVCTGGPLASWILELVQ